MDQNTSRGFQRNKARLLKPPAFHLLENRGRFQEFSDTSETEACSALYLNQKGTSKLIGYANKKLLPAAVNYTITELEHLGLCVNIIQFKYLFVNKILTAQWNI